MRIQTYKGKDVADAQFDYLDSTWIGGRDYRYGKDPDGLEILLPMGDESRADAGYTTKYKKRQALTPYDNHFRRELTRFNSYIWKHEPKREDSNVQALDIVVNDFMTEWAMSALRLGEYFAGVDREDVDTSGMTRAQAQAFQPYFVMIHPKRVMEWDMDENGNYTRFTISERIISKPDISKEAKKQDFAITWYQDRWERWMKEDQGAEYVLINEGRHEYGRVPIVGLSSVFAPRDLADKQRQIFNYESLSLVSIMNHLFPKTVIKGVKNEDEISKTDDNSTILLQSKDASVDRLLADTAQIEQLTKQKQAAVEELLDMVFNDSGLDKRVGESADKKRLDREGLYVMLGMWAKRVQLAENELLTLRFGNDIIPTEYETRKFDVDSRESLIEMINTTQDTMPPEHTRELMLKLASMEAPDDEELVGLIEDQPIISESKARTIQVMGTLDDETVSKMTGVEPSTFETGRKNQVKAMSDLTVIAQNEIGTDNEGDGDV